MPPIRVLPVLLVLAGCKKDEPKQPVADPPTGDTGSTSETDTGTPPPQPCDPLPAEAGTTVSVDLVAAIAAASPGDVLLLEPGTYPVDGTLVLDQPITLRSTTDVASDVVIDMAYGAGDLVQIASSDVTLAHLTLTRSGDALVRTTPISSTITGTVLHDLRLIDPAGVSVVLAPDETETFFADDGAVTCSHLELTNEGRDNVIGGCRTGGIDGSFVRNWEVRDNVIDGFWCEDNLPTSPGIRFYRGARDVVIQRNVLLDSPRGIAAGLTPDQLGRRYDDDPCGDAYAQGIDLVVVNNIVSAWRDLMVYESLFGIEYGIRAESSCNVTLVHNSVAHRELPSSEASIEHSFALTSGVVGNNLTSHAVVRSSDSTADPDSNFELAPANAWRFPSQDDFHLAPAATIGVDQGSTAYLDLVPDDIDREPRDATPDAGADEL